MATITSVSSVINMAIAGLYPQAQQLAGFAADDSFSIAEAATVETMMGIDGRLSGGFQHTPRVLPIVLQADSPSNDIFDQWYSAMESTKEVLTATCVITLPAVGMTYTLNRGFLTRYTPMADNKKVLQPRKYEITFESSKPTRITAFNDLPG